jgi:hypothetical protein
MTGLYNRDGVRLLRGPDWMYKSHQVKSSKGYEQDWWSRNEHMVI